MGNCCRSPTAAAREDVKSSNFSGKDLGRKEKSSDNGKKVVAVLMDVKKERIEDKYSIDRELRRGEFGVTYLCIDRGTREMLACKSISKRKLRTAVDVDDVMSCSSSQPLCHLEELMEELIAIADELEE